MAWTYTADGSTNNNRLTLTGGTVENDLSGLIGMTGVTHHINSQNIHVYEIDSTIRLIINGTLYHDPDTEILIIHHDNTGHAATGAGATALPAVQIVGTASNPAFWYYGTTRSGYGKTTNSKSTGLIFTGTQISNWNPNDACIHSANNNATFVGRGGVVLTNRMVDIRGKMDVDGTVWRGVSPSLEWRNNFGTSLSTFNGTIDGISILVPAFPAILKLDNSNIGETILTAGIEGLTLRDFDVSQNIYDYDIGSDGQNGQGHREWEVINSKSGSDVRKMWRNTRLSVGQRGVVVVKKEVSLNIKDASGSAVSGVKVYLKDTPSSAAKNAVFLAAKGPAGGYTANSSVSRGVVDGSGNLVYDYTTPEVYSHTADANGDVATFVVTTGVQIHDYNANDTDALATNGGPYNIASFSGARWRDGGAEPTYADWDTDKFGGFYKVDRRSNSNTNADDFTFKFCSYAHALSSSTQALKGLGELQVKWVMFADALITADRATADGYTEITTPQAFYNKAKAFLVDNYAGETATIVTREGSTIDAGTYNVTIDASASEVFAFDGSTITIKSAQFVGNLSTTGTITLANGATVLGSYGSQTVLPWEVTNVEATATLQLFNDTQDAEIENIVVGGTLGNKVTASGTYSNSQVSPGDTIRLRITCQAGAGAFEPYEAFGVASTVGISFRADQQPDEVYNANAIDGSAISTLTADFPNIQIDISDADGIADARELYAFYVYQSTTAEGIQKWFGAITAIDLANYRVNTQVADLKLQNVGSVPLVISGARIYRDDNTSILDASPGDQPMTMDAGNLIQYIAPQIDGAMNANAKLQKISAQTKLISALI